jgi:hypothetical protein
VITADKRWGYYLVGNFARLRSPHGAFSVKISAEFEPRDGNNYVEVILSCPAEELLPNCDKAYVVRLGKLHLENNFITHINITVEISSEEMCSGMVYLPICC